MTAQNKIKKGKNSYIVELGLKCGPSKLKRCMFYNAADRLRSKREMQADIANAANDTP